MNMFSSNGVLVAGGAGFVGSAVVRELLSLGHRVVVVDNYLHGCAENLRGLVGDLKLYEIDAADRETLINLLQTEHIEHVVNCIGDTYVPSAYAVPERFFANNLMATLNLLVAAKAQKVKKFVYVSTTEVYGIAEKAKLDEETALAPVNTYAVSKLAADRLCYTFSIEHNFPVVIGRLFNCYGPRETHPYIVPEIISQFHQGSHLRLGNTAARRDFTYVHDTARALISLLSTDQAFGDVVNIGSDCSYSVLDLVKLIAAAMHIESFTVEKDPSRFRILDIDDFRCDNGKLCQLTNWRPTVNIDDGLAMTIQYFNENNFKWSWELSSADSNFSPRNDECLLERA